MRLESIHAAARQHGPWRDLTIQDWYGAAAGFQQIGFDPVAADATALLGLGATETYSSFVIALLLVGAFGVFAGVRVVTGTRSWGAAVAGALVGGSFFIQLLMDGSEGAIVGLVLAVPLLLTAGLALQRRGARELILFALLAAGLQTAYPLFVPPIALGGAVVLAALGARRLRRGRVTAREGTRVAGAVVGVLVLAAALTPSRLLAMSATGARSWTAASRSSACPNTTCRSGWCPGGSRRRATSTTCLTWTR